MDDSKVVVIRNKNNVDLVIFTINGTEEDIEKGVKKIKAMLEGNWSITEIIEELGTMDLSFSWSTDFETIYC